MISKKNEFDIAKIMEKCLSIISLDDEIKKGDNEIHLLYNQKIELRKSLALLQDQVNQHHQTMKIYYQLEGMDFGYRQLKQLRYVILEISKANNISPDKAVSKFLNDIEREYDSLLGFDYKIKEKQDELVLLNDKVIYCRTVLQLQSSIGPALSNLLQKGVTESDIINMNYLVTVFANSNFLTDHAFQNENNGNSNINTKNKPLSRIDYWNLFIYKLTMLSNIDIAIRDQMINLIKLKEEINVLDNKKKELDDQCIESISLLNYVNSQTSHSIEMFNQVFNNINKKPMATVIPPPFVLLSMKLRYTRNNYKEEEEE